MKKLVPSDYFGEEISPKDNIYMVFPEGQVFPITGEVAIKRLKRGTLSDCMYFKSEKIANDYAEYIQAKFSLKDVLFSSSSVLRDYSSNYFLTHIIN